MAGLELDPWQQFILINALGEREDHKWSAPTVAMVLPRQNGKNSVLEARELAGLFLLGERVIIHSAHEQATASEQFRRLLALIEDEPELKKKMLRAVHGKGSEAIEMKTGQRILFKTRTGGGGRGFTVDCIVCDEAYELPEGAVAALMPTKSAQSMHGNVQTWYASSAVDQQKHQYGHALARQREAGLAGQPGVAYFEWSVEGNDPSRVPEEIANDPELWAQANPSLGIRISADYVRHERNVELGPREFAVERLGIGDWPSSDPDAGRMITVRQWVSLTDEDSTIDKGLVLAIDVAPDFSMGTISGAGLRKDGAIHVGVIARESKGQWIPQRLAELVKMQRPAAVIADNNGTVIALIPELEKLGVNVTLTTAKEYAQACMMFAEGVNNATVFHVDEPDLTIAIDRADSAPLGDGWKWKKRDHDITSLVSVTLAYWGVAAKKGKPKSRYFNPAAGGLGRGEVVTNRSLREQPTGGPRGRAIWTVN